MPFVSEHHRILQGTRLAAPRRPAMVFSACLGIPIATFRKRGFIC